MKTRIREIRESQKLTRKQLAEMAVGGITATALVKWEDGTNEIGLDKAERIARALHCTLSELIGPDAPQRDHIAEMVASSAAVEGVEDRLRAAQKRHRDAEAECTRYARAIGQGAPYGALKPLWDEAQERGEHAGTGRTMPPHVRAAHFTHYWVGPRKGRTDGRPGDACIVHWIPPIAVNGGGGEEVVHPVRRH